VQVSWNDAAAYCRWAGKRLPTEAEWEYAARGGIEGQSFPWGKEFQPEGKWMANTWQGTFPLKDEGGDGHQGLAPVKSYPPNGYGLHDMAGNAWEWVADWYDPAYYRNSLTDNPPGPATGEERIMRGGSWMCSDNYCLGYRVAQRNKATPDSGLNNTGFRCAMSVK
jgi:sulfatase modifying factor 1